MYSTQFKCSLPYAKQAFYHSANSLLFKVANAASEEVMPFVNSKCFQVLLYGVVVMALRAAWQQSKQK